MNRERQIILVKGVANFKPAFEGFVQKGFRVESVEYDLVKISRLAKETPSIIVALYFNDSVFEIARVTECPIVAWLVDKVTIRDSTGLGIDLSRLFVFSFDPVDVDSFRKAGFKNSWYLRCSSGFEYSKLDRVHGSYEYDISFVGESITVKHNPYFQLLLNYSKMLEHINVVVEKQLPDFTENTLSARYEKEYSGQFSIQYMLDFLRMLDQRELDFILGCEASSRLRKKLVSSLDQYNLHIFGDDFWADIKKGRIQLHKESAYPHETATIYCLSKINLNISRLFFSGIIQRVYDIIYCGGFCLTDFRADLSDCFEPDKEIVFYSSGEELKEKVHYYLKNSEERESIARRGRERLMKEHRTSHRIDFIVKKLSESGI